MLIRITSNTSGDMIMFAEHARMLFDIIGKECTARGVFTCEQLPDAISRLKTAILEEKQSLLESERKAHAAGFELEEEDQNDEDHKSGRIGIHLGQRAAPLLHLMEWTQKEKGFVLWEADCDF